MSKDDLRFKKTEKAIKSAFLQLAQKYPLEDITIKEITALSECNRNTFYLHYTDKYDLLHQLCDAEIEVLKKDLRSLPLQKYTSKKEWYLDCAKTNLNTIEAHWDFYLPILGQNKYPPFADRFGKIGPDYIHSVLKEFGSSPSTYNDFTLQFLSSGMTGIIRCWLLEPEKYTKELLIKEFEILITELGTIIFE